MRMSGWLFISNSNSMKMNKCDPMRHPPQGRCLSYNRLAASYELWLAMPSYDVPSAQLYNSSIESVFSFIKNDGRQLPYEVSSIGWAIKLEHRFEKAFFRSSFVKILANTEVLAAFCALVEQKNALFKILDRKGRKFRGIFVSVGRSNALALRERTEQKAPKCAALRRVRV